MIDQQFLVVMIIMGLIHFFLALGVWFMIYTWNEYRKDEDKPTGYLMSCVAYSGIICFIAALIFTMDGIFFGVVRYVP